MLSFSIFVSAAEGSTFGIVSYVDIKTGSVAGLVGAGGNIGGACFSYLLVHYDYRTSFLYMGIAVVASAIWTAFIKIPGHRSLFTGHDCAEIVQARRQAKLPAVIVIDGGGCDISEHSKDEENSCGDSVDAL